MNHKLMKTDQPINPKGVASLSPGLASWRAYPGVRVESTHNPERIAASRSNSGLTTASFLLIGSLLLAGCSFAPKYDKPAVATPGAFRELTPTEAKQTDGWKAAEPQDNAIRSNWWEMFQQPELNALEVQITVTNNQMLAIALQNFILAREVMKATGSEYFPTVTANPSAAASGGVSGSPQIRSYTLPLNASWQPDFWGSIRNSVKANALAAEATLGDLENMRLSLQGELAADYFQLRELDSLKQLLDATAGAYRDSLNLTRVLHKTGIASDQDVAQAETQLHTTLAQATDLGIQRAQLEHAIATLLGKPASEFALGTNALTAHPIPIPFGVPSQLLERRPDIAAAERRVAAANAQIGVARSAYFPTITLSGQVGFNGEQIGNLGSGPTFLWSLGASAAETLFDAGKRKSVTKEAWASYRANVGNYRQTVLAAFQSVEDNLATLRVLSEELKQQSDAVASSQRYLNLAKDRYRLGIDSYLNVITAQTTLLANQRTELNLRAEQMTASVQLVEGLGGGWDGALATAEVRE